MKKIINILYQQNLTKAHNVMHKICGEKNTHFIYLIVYTKPSKVDQRASPDDRLKAFA